MMADKLCDLVSFSEDGVRDNPDWRTGELFLEALNAFLKSEKGVSDSKSRYSKRKTSNDQLITVSDVLGDDETSSNLG